MIESGMWAAIEALRSFKALEKPEGILGVNVETMEVLLNAQSFSELAMILRVTPESKEVLPDAFGSPTLCWRITVDGVTFHTYESKNMKLEHSWEAKNPPVDK